MAVFKSYVTNDQRVHPKNPNRSLEKLVYDNHSNFIMIYGAYNELVAGVMFANLSSSSSGNFPCFPYYQRVYPRNPNQLHYSHT